jgi:hypothetical protein
MLELGGGLGECHMGLRCNVTLVSSWFLTDHGCLFTNLVLGIGMWICQLGSHCNVTLVSSEVLVTFHGALLEIVSFEVINAASLSALSLWGWGGSVLDV